MADQPAEYGLSKADVILLREIARFVRAQGFGGGGLGTATGGSLGGRGVIRAKATSTIAAGTAGTVTLCDSGWTKLTGTGSTIQAVNDSLVPITHSGTDIKLYLVPDSEGHMAILTAFLCEP